jgi:hypothetical protein
MEKAVINFEEFELDFLNSSNEEIENEVTDNDDEEVDNDELKENMQSRIPNQTIYLGSIETEEENWTSWRIQDEYYIHPLINDEFDWALFRITWDDNWGRWEWSFDARLKGFKTNYKDAATFIIVKLWRKWKINLNKKANKIFVDFLERI